MICTNCQSLCPEGHRFCHNCGHPLAEELLLTQEPVPAEEAVTLAAEEAAQPPLPEEPSAQPLPVQEPSAPEFPPLAYPLPIKPRKGRLWPALAMMAVMLCFGLALYFLIPLGSGGPGSADSPIKTDGPFELVDGELTFYEHLYTGGSELIVPRTIGGEKVTAIADYAFYGCEDIMTVILPDTVEFIGEAAFFGCSDLRGIFLGSSVISIGTDAFGQCEDLEAIRIPASVTSIGQYAFDGCDSLRHIFYGGTFTQWLDLYKQPINPYVSVYASNKTFQPG